MAGTLCLSASVASDENARKSAGCLLQRPGLGLRQIHALLSALLAAKTAILQHRKRCKTYCSRLITTHSTHPMTNKSFVPRQMVKTCALCRDERHLENSHIIPRFMRRLFVESRYFDWANPGKPEQDLAKFPLLCRKCEQRFSKNEKVIAQRLHAALGKPTQGLPTQTDELYFAISVLWRAHQAITRFQLSGELFPTLTEKLHAIRPSLKVNNSLPTQSAQAQETVENWRCFLLADEKVGVSPQHRHWTLTDTVAQTVGGGSGRYATGWNLITGPTYQSVVVLMGHWVFIGPLLAASDVSIEAIGVRHWLNLLAEQNRQVADENEFENS